MLFSNKISSAIRIHVFVTLVSSIFLNDSELWSLLQVDNPKIDTFLRSFLCKITRNCRISNNQLYKICHPEPRSVAISISCRTTLPPNVCLHRQSVHGGQPTTWLSTVTKDLKTTNWSLSEAATSAQDREKYAKLVNSAIIMPWCQQAAHMPRRKTFERQW